MGAAQNKSKAPNSANRVFKTTKTITIPNLTELRKELGYDNPGQQEDIFFKRAIREQVDSFVSPIEELPGYFLDTKGNGPRFWPDRHSSTKDRFLEYSKDSAKITRLMIKVFWRTACEYKRYRTLNSTIPQPQFRSNEVHDPPEDTEVKPIDIRPQVAISTDNLKGLSVDNPIDIEEMQPDDGITAPLTDVDPFSGAEVPNFTSFDLRAPENTSDEWPSSEPPYAYLFSSGDIPDCRPLEFTDRPQTVRPENMRGADLYDGPNSPPAVAQNAQNNGKRPAETNPNNNNRQAKVPRQDQIAPERHAAKVGRKAQSAPTATRRSNRERRAPDRPGAATEEEMEAAENSPTPSSPESGRYADKGQQAKDKADSSLSKASTSHPRGTDDVRRDSQRQTSTESSRAEAARLAARRTDALHAAVEADIVDQPTRIVNILARVRGKQPALLQRQTPVAQAGSSRERESLEESAPQPTVDAARTESRPPPGVPDTVQEVDPNIISDDQVRNLNACVIIYKSNIGRQRTYVTRELSDVIFRMSLADVSRELGVEGRQRLYFRFKHQWANIDDDFGRVDTDKFRTVMVEWLRIINDQCAENASSPVAQRPRLGFQVYISTEPIKT
ncbi:hypothetical protein FGRMN_2648 [Fusarium graminum]|nr:hypothetical protein FGRMN_2648 [Fusarium graminum]